MSTRSLIGIEREDKIVKAVYCHWDGYPSHNGKMLLQYFDSADAANDLIDKGDLSSINEGGTVEDYFTSRNEQWADVAPRGHESRADFFLTASDSWAEYVYLWSIGEGRWLVSPASHGRTEPRWSPLRHVVDSGMYE